jgi:hypothetical protein
MGMRRWRRAYALDDGMGAWALSLVLAGSGAILAAVALIVDGRWHAVYLAFWLTTTLLLPASRVGLYVSDRGVRVRGYWSTHTMEWRDVAAIDTVAVGIMRRDSIRIITRQGTKIRTPVRRGAPGSWRPALKPGQRSGLTFRMVPSAEFDRLLAQFRARSGPSEVRPEEPSEGPEQGRLPSIRAYDPPPDRPGPGHRPWSQRLR